MWLIKLICFIFVAWVIFEIFSVLLSILNGIVMLFIVIFTTFKNLIDRLVNIISKTKDYVDDHYVVEKVEENDDELKF